MQEFKDAYLAMLIDAGILITERSPAMKQKDLRIIQAKRLRVRSQPEGVLLLLGVNLQGEPFSMLYHGHYYVEFKEV